MRLSHFFIDRPIFATVLSVFITLVGGFAYFSLPVAQYPDIAPPTVVVNALYPGASAQVIRSNTASLRLLLAAIALRFSSKPKRTICSSAPQLGKAASRAV